MVYRGRSRACAPCKKRRKNCDQTRPSCLRCIKANRACAGYEEVTSWSFQPYKAPGTGPLPPFQSRARKCTLPRRGFIPGTDVLVTDVDNGEAEVSREQRRDYGVRAFFYDFCVLPSDSVSSRGYLSSLERTVDQLGQDSMLGRACEAVSHISHGQSTQRPQLIRNSEAAYHELVGSLAEAIQGSGLSITAECKLVSMLLGVYELSRYECTTSSSHSTHAKGLGALLGTGDSPLSLLNSLSSGYLVGHRKDKASGPGKVHALFSMPRSINQPVNLDSLILQLDMLWESYKTLHYDEEYHSLRADCEALKARFATWDCRQASETRPTTVTTLRRAKEVSVIPVGCWPGRVDTYSDFYIAGIWNIARAARLLLAMLTLRLSGERAGMDTPPNYDQATEAIVEDMIASIPYHLTDNLYVFLDGPRSGIEDPGRRLGGLLMMHPLYIASQVSSIPENTRDYLRRCLMWISSDMGLGHAARLAQSQDIDEEFLRSACMIIWTGFLG